MEIKTPDKKVLIITYYWPPSGGSGVQRCLKFVKYLREFGWEPVVYTPSNPENPTEDYSLLSDIPSRVTVIKKPIWEPYNLYKKATGKKSHEKIQHAFVSDKKNEGVREKISLWIRSNLFIPDARMFWVKPSVKYLTKYLKENKIDIVFTSGPPHSLHLIGLQLKKQLNINWVADFRDPWTQISYYSDLKLTLWANKKHHKLEKKVLQNADKVIVIGNDMKKQYEVTYGIFCEIITNGYDEQDINKDDTITPVNKFNILHSGLMNKQRNPKNLWKILSQISNEDDRFKHDLQIELIGKTDAEAVTDIINAGLEAALILKDSIPHTDIVSKQRSSAVLLSVINNTEGAKGIITGKLFEYLAAQRPVLCIGPEDGDAAQIIKDAHAGYTLDYSNTEDLYRIIKQLYKQYLNNELTLTGNSVEKYSRRNLTKHLASTFDFLINEK
jgi:hypothetical protein